MTKVFISAHTTTLLCGKQCINGGLFSLLHLMNPPQKLKPRTLLWIFRRAAESQQASRAEQSRESSPWRLNQICVNAFGSVLTLICKSSALRLQVFIKKKKGSLLFRAFNSIT